jgi:hypothetical protein
MRLPELAACRQGEREIELIAGAIVSGVSIPTVRERL